MRTNRLVNETSPYLLQHAHNPVDWYPWSNEAFEKARKEEKIVFLSIGYSSCHWCHVMEKESFEDEDTAKILNENFVSIKVDREERPDLDSHYMNAVSAMIGSGGWPLSVFLTPDKKPFYGGTYFPKDARLGMPAFKQVLTQINALYKKDKEQIVKNANKLTDALESMATQTSTGEISQETISKSIISFQNSFDSLYGGFKGRIKFPQPIIWDFLLMHAFTSKNSELIYLVTKTLDNIAKGGIYDQIGGGFCRYSTDEKWLTPHFEKMLYDNALLTHLYINAYQTTKDNNYKRIIEESFSYVEHNLKDEKGAFFSAQDADSEGVEGKYYIWSFEELEKLLSKGEIEILKSEFGATKEGNFEEKNILTRKNLADTPEIRILKQKLLNIRQKRVSPLVDDKIIVSWNSLMIISFAKAAKVFNNNHYKDIAEKAVNFIWTDLFKTDRLYHSYAKGKIGGLGFSDDYAAFALANLTLFETTGEKHWIENTFKITKLLVELFWDKKGGGIFHVSFENKDSDIPHYKDFYDNPLPSGNSLSGQIFAKLNFLTGNEEYREKLEKILSLNTGQIDNSPSMFGSLLQAMELYFAKPVEIAVVAKTQDEINKYLNAIYDYYLPSAAIASKINTDLEIENILPLLQDKQISNSKALVYICENFACKKPIESINDLKSQLQTISKIK